MRKIFLTLLFAGLIVDYSEAQQWGLYTLYAPINNTQVFLIDTNSTTYKTWTFTSAQKNGFSVYLIPGDTLIRPVAHTGNSFNGGGMTGEVQKVTWNGTVVWDYVYSTSTYCLHHDVCPLPNGNVLLTCYESKSATEATNAGCSQSITIWSEKLIEVKPTGATTGTIVWEWHLWDHLCQNYSSTKPNYVTDISQHPELMNINYNTSKDWIHMNGIDYNVALDQITFSSRTMNEIYVIDHSTTTAEAATHSGGNSGKGGDLLYRWGNPAAYGVTGTKVFTVVHDAHWVAGDHPSYPNYLCGFNNAGGAGNKSSIDIIAPPYDGYNYSYTPGQAMLPATYAYRHTSTYTSNSNGASQQLPNGNILVCASTASVLYEINSAGTTLWSKTVSGQPANALRYEKCYVRGPKVTASTTSSQVCSGDPLTLNSVGSSLTETNPIFSYAWSSPSGTTSSDQNPVINPTVSEYYHVTVTDNSVGCSAVDSVFVDVLPEPAAPVITQNGDTLTSTQGETYQWYLDGNPVPGATSQDYEPVVSGSYQVEISDVSGCTAMSAALDFIVTEISATQNSSLDVFPNPTTGWLQINHNLPPGTDFECNIISLMGERVLLVKNQNEIDITSLSNGVYYLELRSEKIDILTKKVVLLK